MAEPTKRYGGSSMKAIHVPALTGLRFIAAMMVLIGHGWPVLHFTGDTITGRFLDPLPSMGMTLFFVLSGFVMWVNYADSFRERQRLLPLLILVEHLGGGAEENVEAFVDDHLEQSVVTRSGDDAKSVLPEPLRGRCA